MLYSIRMRSAQGGPHEEGGRHISGAERLIDEKDISHTADALVQRALNHERGAADFIRLTIESVKQEDIITIPMLNIETYEASDVKDGHRDACRFLISAGISPKAVNAAMDCLLSLQENMRGAVLLDAETGVRLDDSGMRGIRVSRMDFKDGAQSGKHFKAGGCANVHLREAVVLASKVLSAPGIMGELCWSDDPDYIIGYVSANGTYHRVTKMKPMHSMQGGRVFFVKSSADISAVKNYLEKQPVLVDVNL